MAVDDDAIRCDTATALVDRRECLDGSFGFGNRFGLTAVRRHATSADDIVRLSLPVDAAERHVHPAAAHVVGGQQER